MQGSHSLKDQESRGSEPPTGSCGHVASHSFNMVRVQDPKRPYLQKVLAESNLRVERERERERKEQMLERR